jgi:hypothetical protein
MLAKMREEKEAAAAPSGKAPILARVKAERDSPEVMQDILTQAGVRIGDPISSLSENRIREAAKSIDEHLRVEFARDGQGGLVLVVIAR